MTGVSAADPVDHHGLSADLSRDLDEELTLRAPTVGRGRQDRGHHRVDRSSGRPDRARIEVRVSQTVKDLVAGSGLTFEDADEHELKGVPNRWHLYRVVK